MTRKIFFVLLSSTVSILFTACTSSKESTGSGQLIIQEQGGFAVVGTVITNPGSFDPIKQGAYTPTNQSSEGVPHWHGVSEFASLIYKADLVSLFYSLIKFERRKIWQLVFIAFLLF